MDCLNRFGGQLQPLFAGEALPRAGMQDKVFGAQGEGAFDLAAKGGDRVAAHFFSLTAEIDQVTRVDDQRRAVVFCAQFLHLLAVVGGDLRWPPHARAR